MRVAEGPSTRPATGHSRAGRRGLVGALAAGRSPRLGFAESAYPLASRYGRGCRHSRSGNRYSRALAVSLEAVAERERVQGVVLFSDGGHNLGRDPVQLSTELGVPVYALGVGRAEVPVDVPTRGLCAHLRPDTSVRA